MGERRRDRDWSMQVTALYDYEPEQSDELGFEEGDVLRVLRVQEDGWWSGYNVENPDGVGLFPSNYVQAQRTSPMHNTKGLVEVVTTPRPPASSRQRIQQQPRQAPDTPEFEHEDDAKVQELRGEYRGHVGAVLQLRKNLEEAERASEAVRDARRQAERERLRHRKSWREQEQQEEIVEEEDMNQVEPYRGRSAVLADRQQQETPPDDGEDTEDDDEPAFPQRQGYKHESDRQQAEEAENAKSPSEDDENETQTDVGQEQIADMASAEKFAAAMLLARGYRRHVVIVQKNREREREAGQQKQISEIAAGCIQRWATHAYSRQHKRRQRELEQNTVRRRWERENSAAADIQRWIRLRWACFWRRRVQIEREELAAREAQQARQREELIQAEHHQGEMLRQEAENEEMLRRLENEEEECQQLRRGAEVEEEEQRRVLQHKLEAEVQQQQQRQLQLTVVEEEVQRRFLQTEGQEEEREVGSATPSLNVQALSPDKPRRKVMKKEAVELVKTLVQQQLGETLRDHDVKMDELQRMVARLQTVVRKQTAMLEDSTDQLVALQMGQRLPMPPRSNDAGSCSFLPRIGGQPAVPRQPVAPSGLRAPRPVVMSKLPVLARGATCNQSKKT